MATVENHLPESKVPASNGLFGLISNLAIKNVILTYVSRHDALTGLLNKDACKGEIEERMRGEQPFGVIIMDLDGFKAVNDTLGHAEGDRLLEDFGAHLQSEFRREGDVIAHEKMINQPVNEDETEVPMGRYGGDEFVIVPDLSDRDRKDGLNVAERMDKAMEYTRDVVADFVGQQEQSIRDLGFNASIGGATWEPGSTATLTDLMKNADSAMYEDKRAHGAPVR
jgi:GGDEF domain-containing protein